MAELVLKKCEVCPNMIPPFTRNGVPITRQSRYNERKCCCDECVRILKGGTAMSRAPAFDSLPAIDQWLLRGTHA